jgi:hypothetical protein
VPGLAESALGFGVTPMAHLFAGASPIRLLRPRSLKNLMLRESD